MVCRAIVEYKENLPAFLHHVAVELHKPLGEKVAGHPGFGVVLVTHGPVVSKPPWLPRLPNDKWQLSITAVHVHA